MIITENLGILAVNPKTSAERGLLGTKLVWGWPTAIRSFTSLYPNYLYFGKNLLDFLDETTWETMPVYPNPFLLYRLLSFLFLTSVHLPVRFQWSACNTCPFPSHVCPVGAGSNNSGGCDRISKSSESHLLRRGATGETRGLNRYLRDRSGGQYRFAILVRWPISIRSSWNSHQV